LSQPPIARATDMELATAVQENLRALFRAMAAALPQSALVEGNQLCYHYAFPTNPMFKGVWQTRVAPEDLDAAIGQTLEWFRARSAPFLFWWVGMGGEPASLPERLQAHGFLENIHGDSGMAADLQSLSTAISVPDSLQIAQVADQQMLEDWRDAFCAANEISLWAGQAWVDATQRIGIASAPWQLYVGYWSGRSVASNILFNGAGVASVYGVGTVPEVRGRGIGAAITLRPLLDARAQGYRYGVLSPPRWGTPSTSGLGSAR
jgi:ribosomal protein S18 acetylase RimI-like enzyme